MIVTLPGGVAINPEHFVYGEDSPGRSCILHMSTRSNIHVELHLSEVIERIQAMEAAKKADECVQ
jgi:hypothetical protein